MTLLSRGDENGSFPYAVHTSDRSEVQDCGVVGAPGYLQRQASLRGKILVLRQLRRPARGVNPLLLDHHRKSALNIACRMLSLLRHNWQALSGCLEYGNLMAKWSEIEHFYRNGWVSKDVNEDGSNRVVPALKTTKAGNEILKFFEQVPVVLKSCGFEASGFGLLFDALRLNITDKDRFVFRLAAFTPPDICSLEYFGVAMGHTPNYDPRFGPQEPPAGTSNMRALGAVPLDVVLNPFIFTTTTEEKAKSIGQTGLRFVAGSRCDLHFSAKNPWEMPIYQNAGSPYTHFDYKPGKNNALVVVNASAAMVEIRYRFLHSWHLGRCDVQGDTAQAYSRDFRERQAARPDVLCYSRRARSRKEYRKGP